MYYLTQYANDLIEFEYPDWINIFSVYETVRHDCFDEYGPQTDIWDLYIVYENYNGERLVDKWSWEDWFNPMQPTGYIEGICRTYSFEQFWTNPYFSFYICPHLAFG